jgi:dTDP-4-dehydrorhamnose reductase
VKIAVTGSDGMLGHDITDAFRDDAELITFTINDFDITDLNETNAKIREAHPDCVIHSAAYTDVDGCEQESERAYRINGLGTRNVVMACEGVGCPILYISTDYVFDGAKGSPYIEWDVPNPVNTYGASKLLGEHYVMALTNRFYIVRTSWLYGKNGNNFVSTISNLLSERDEIHVVSDQIGSPTFTCDLALKLKEIIGRGYGIYHITNSSYCSWHEFAVEIGRLRSSNSVITPTTTEQFNRPARRPSYSVLDNTLLRLEGIEELRTWKDALRDYLSRFD